MTITVKGPVHIRAGKELPENVKKAILDANIPNSMGLREKGTKDKTPKDKEKVAEAKDNVEGKEPKKTVMNKIGDFLGGKKDAN